MSLSNYEKWLAYTDGLSSPNNFINWGYIYTISACLQRRVWIGDNDSQLFPNINVILVGEPGVGKGLVIKAVTSLVKHWYRKDKTKDDFMPDLMAMTELAVQAQIVQEAGNEQAAGKEYQGHQAKGGKEIIKPLLFPVAADATTFEALVEAVSESITHINYVKYNTDGTKSLGHYGHCSLCFLLPELSYYYGSALMILSIIFLVFMIVLWTLNTEQKIQEGIGCVGVVLISLLALLLGLFRALLTITFR